MTGGDITRSSFAPLRHFSGVRMQQGRVQLDADWNEQLDIQAHRDAAGAIDVIGPAGAHKHGGGFQLAATPDGTDLAISPGRLWVDGTLCELDAEQVPADNLTASQVTVANLLVDGRALAANQWVALSSSGAAQPLVVRLAGVDTATRRLSFAAAIDPSTLPGTVTLRRVTTYATQPDLPDPDHTKGGDTAGPRTLDLDDGAYLAYLEVWQRHVTALEEPAIREVALGGPDTATRTRIVAQVRLLALGTPGTPIGCDSDLPAWDALVAPPAGRMAAQTVPEPPASTPCILPPSGGFQGLENQLYRVEIHEVLNDGTTRFKWSRENGSVAVPWLGRSGDQLTVAHPGRDRALGFTGGDWVELTDDTRDLQGRPGTLVRLLKAEAESLVVDQATATGPLDLAAFPRQPKVRRWDSPGAVTVERDTPIDLENGVQVLFPSGGGYRVGDHWLIPARTATADVDWPRDAGGRPLPLPPAGIHRGYARLALLHAAGGVQQSITDCRDRFPALTALEAADVAFDNSTCDLPGTGTVQDAIDRLCQERDLRFHNRHLHGWGIVCGLEVHCGPDPEGAERRTVTVLPGYAIDAEGNDRDIAAPGVGVDVLGAVETLEAGGEQVLDDNGNGEVCLRLGTDAELRTIVEVEPFKPEPASPPPWLTGTLLLDFYDDCVKPVHDWLREQLTPTPEEENLPASPASQRLSALTNLLAQVANPTSGRNVFVSPREDLLIREFYTGLRALLQSETFCAMFERARPLPDYPFAGLRMNAIFTTGNHRRLRLHPGGREAFSVGAGVDPRQPRAFVNRYDLRKGVQTAVIDPLAGSQQASARAATAAADTGAGAIQDVAISPDGKRVFVAVAGRSEDNTIFRAGTIGADRVDWAPTVTLCGVKLVTLATTAADPASVYAVALKKVSVTEGGKTVRRWEGAGLLKLNPDAIDPDNLPQVPIPGFVPVGPLAVTADGQLALAGTAPNQPADRYTHLAHLLLPAAQELTPRIALPTGGNATSGDVAFLTRPGSAAPTHLYAVTDPPAGAGRSNFISGFEVRTGTPVAAFAVTGDPTAMRLLGLGDLLVVTLEDRAHALLYDAIQGKQVSGYLLPLQMAPSSIVHEPRSGIAYVLNRLSNTISVVPPAQLKPDAKFPLAELVNYRKAMLEGFADLLGGFLQYLKDCLVDHFLVKCPQPTGDEKLYLGCVSIRGKQVYKVCNFSKRRYVKSFPAVGYWLSLIPVLPLLRSMLERWACAVLPDYFGTIEVPAFDEEGNLTEDRVSVGTLDKLIAWAHTNDPLGRIKEVGARSKVATTTMAMALSGFQPGGATVPGPRVAASSIVGQPAERVAEDLARLGATVQRTVFDPSSLGVAMSALAGLFREPAPGKAVTLYEEAGTTRLFSVADPAEPVVADLRGQIATLTTALAQRDQALSALQSRIGALERAQAELSAARPATRRRTPRRPSGEEPSGNG